MSDMQKHKQACSQALLLLEKRRGQIDDLDVILDVLPLLIKNVSFMTPDSELEDLRRRLNDKARGYEGAVEALAVAGEEHQKSAALLHGMAQGLTLAASFLSEINIPF